jgi:hypothetical protein
MMHGDKGQLHARQKAVRFFFRFKTVPLPLDLVYIDFYARYTALEQKGGAAVVGRPKSMPIYEQITISLRNGRLLHCLHIHCNAR